MNMSRLLSSMCVFLAFGFSTANVQASVIISPVTATASSNFDGSTWITRTIDHTGLSVDFTSGVTDLDTYLAGNPLHTNIAANNEWFSALNVTSATIDYDLGNSYSIDRLVLWNEETAGIGSLDISVSLDNVNFTTIASGLTPLDNPLSLDYGAEVIGIGTHTARYIRFDVGNCPQPDGLTHALCAIGEVAFATSAIPIPASVWLFGSGLIGLAGIARRRKNTSSPLKQQQQRRRPRSPLHGLFHRHS